MSDDASNWKVSRSVLGKTKGLSSGTLAPFTEYTINPTTNSPGIKPDGLNPIFVQKTSGQKLIFVLDAPDYLEHPDSLIFVANFTFTFCSLTPANCTEQRYYVKIVVKPGGIIDNSQSRVALGFDPEVF